MLEDDDEVDDEEEEEGEYIIAFELSSSLALIINLRTSVATRFTVVGNHLPLPSRMFILYPNSCQSLAVPPLSIHNRLDIYI